MLVMMADTADIYIAFLWCLSMSRSVTNSVVIFLSIVQQMHTYAIDIW